MASPNIVNEVSRANIIALIDYTGSTTRAAAFLGVSPRTVQRYVTSGAQKRNPNAAVRAKLATAPSTRRSTNVVYDGDIRVNSYVRTRTIEQAYSPDEWASLSLLAVSGNPTPMWDFIAEMYGGTVWEMELEDGTIDIE